jgi:hypothetical protein
MDADNRQHRMEQFFEALRVLRMSWVVALIAVLVLVVPGQVHDLYRTLAENLRRAESAAAGLRQAAITALLLFVAAFLITYVGRHRAAVRMSKVPAPGPVLSASLRWGPPVCGTLLLAGAVLGMLLAALDVSSIADNLDRQIDPILAEMKAATRYLTFAAIALAAAGVLFLLATYTWDRRGGAPVPPSATAFSRPWQLLCYAVAIFMIATAFVPSVSVPLAQQAGSLAIFLLFISVLMVVLSLLQSASDRHGIPYILLLVIWALSWTVLDAGNMHRVVFVERSKDAPDASEIGPRFQEWLAARKDKEAFDGQPYPVYLVSAEAGGLYAAQFTAKVLARIQDQCPNFAQHVFAISGVSGGSLGAAIFSSLAKKEATNAPWSPCKLEFDALARPGPLEKKVDALLEQDFLAPIVSRALFADFLQHFVPVSLASDLPLLSGLTQLSRGRALEESIEDAWARQGGAGKNPFARPFLEHWDATDAGPALLINTTNVEDGRLMVIAPFRAAAQEAGSDVAYLHSHAVVQDKDITLGTAVGLSGRFPWILPPAKMSNSPLALVDGAYFESSGLETLRSLRFALRPFERGTQPLVKVHTIVIGSQQPAGVSTQGLLDEATPPVRAMLNVRLRRGYSVRNALLDENLRRALRDCPSAGLQTLNTSEGATQNQVRSVSCSASPEPQFSLQYELFNLPLGWKLSHGMQSIVEQHSRGRCLTLDRALAKEVNPYTAEEILVKNRVSEYLVAYSLTPSERSVQLLEEFNAKCRPAQPAAPTDSQR